MSQLACKRAKTLPGTHFASFFVVALLTLQNVDFVNGYDRVYAGGGLYAYGWGSITVSAAQEGCWCIKSKHAAVPQEAVLAAHVCINSSINSSSSSSSSSSDSSCALNCCSLPAASVCHPWLLACTQLCRGQYRVPRPL